MMRSFARFRWLGIPVAATWLAALPAAAQSEDSIRIVSEAVEVGIGGRLQTQFNTTTVEDEPESELIIRRARLELSVRVNELVSGRIHPDFAGERVSLRDVYLQLDFDPAFQLRTGKFYRPFSLLEQTTATRILPIERGLAIRGVDGLDENALLRSLRYADRDIGIQVMGQPKGAPLGLSYAAGVFQGPAHAVGDEATYQFVARTTVQPVSDVRLGAAWNNRAFTRSAPADGDFDITRGSAYEVDVEVGNFGRGFHLLGEVAVGAYDAFTDQNFVAAQAWLAYRTAPVGRISGVEPTFRVSYADVDLSAPGAAALGGTLVTPGINVHLGGRNRVMFNYDRWLAAGDAEDHGSFKTMFQLAF